MKRYIRCETGVDNYKGYDIGFDAKLSKYYFICDGTPVYHDDIDGLKSKIDKCAKGENLEG